MLRLRNIATPIEVTVVVMVPALGASTDGGDIGGIAQLRSGVADGKKAMS